MGYIVINNACSTLATGLTATDTSIVVQPGHGARFDVGTNYTYATLENSDDVIEIVKVIARSGDTLTVVRGQDGTNAVAWSPEDVIEVRPCRAAFNDLIAAPLVGVTNLFLKADPMTVAFTKTGSDTASIKAGTKIEVAGTVVTFDTATPIVMPTLAAGTDYAIWVKDDATIQATANFSMPPSAGNWRKIGGFHYAPGGNATAQSGGDDTPTINEYSFWDLKFRPICPDPRGMTLVAGLFWADIYLLGVDHLINGTSRYNVTIADGSSPPRIPFIFGGDGTATYSNFNWWVAGEVLQFWGKRLPTYHEFAALAYGTTEATSSGGTDVPTTGVDGTGATNTWNKFTSRWGVIQATGCMWVWGANFGGGAASSGWLDNTGGRGSTWQMENASLFGGAWSNATRPGSRASTWANSPAISNNVIGARGVADHVIIY